MNNPLIGYATGIIFGIFTGYRFNDGLILAITAPVVILSIYRLIDSHKHLLLATLIAFVIGHVSALSDMHHREDEIEKLTSCSPAPIIITATHSRMVFHNTIISTIMMAMKGSASHFLLMNAFSDLL